LGSYILRRLLIALPSLLGISVVLFTVLAMAPGDPFEELATNPNVPPEVRMQLRASLGLDDPVWQRYWHWLTSMLQGDWGFSFISRLDVDTLIWQRLPVTIAIIGLSQLVALAIALLWALMQLAAPILPEISWQDLPLAGLSAIPVSAALIAWGATIVSILLWLRRLP
jgi:peptide/nickel transport system permease protein